MVVGGWVWAYRSRFITQHGGKETHNMPDTAEITRFSENEYWVKWSNDPATERGASAKCSLTRDTSSPPPSRLLLYVETHTHTHTHTDCSRNWVRILVRMEIL